MKIIARIHTDFPKKFGIPRQSGICPTVGKIVFEPEFRSPESLRGIEGYSHLWLIWEFSEAKREDWSPTVRPPRLGGNLRMGVFATRSPYRPNPIGLSSVRLLAKEEGSDGTTLLVEGADLLDGTPILDIKPYLAYTDSHPDAVGGFSDNVRNYSLNVNISSHFLNNFDDNDQKILRELLANDPRPSYQDDPERVYFMKYKNVEISFTVEGTTLTVTDVRR